ncbi:FxsA family protein [Janibacter sp. G1551]|uniref:FxsA family protein n=1 Tax=Janibacter sp. G1551 TaxID=3420440 RepID=UPI003D0851FF
MAPPVNDAPHTTARPHRRRRRVLAVLAVLLLVVPTIEIAVLIGVGRVIGAWPTIALLLVESAIGAWLVRREGGRTWQALSVALTTGRMPSRELADAALVLIGGTLLLSPGFVSDILGYVLIAPVTRPVARRALEAVIARRLLGGFMGGFGPTATRPGAGSTGRSDGPDIIEGEVL